MKPDWKKVKGQKGIESTKFFYQCQGWKKERQFVAIRRLVDDKIEQTLFPIPQYEFFCYVTNLKISPWKIPDCNFFC
jgi:hypothetical protein